MTKKLNGKTAIITGASTGIGRAIAKLFSEQGANVGLISRNIKELNKTLDIIKKNNGNGKIFNGDLTKYQDMKNIIKNIQDEFENIDILVNAAGVWHNEDKVYYGDKLWEVSDEEIKEVLDVGIYAPMLLTKELVKSMIKNQTGKIIQISGTFESGASGWLHYFVSKKAIEQFTVGLSEELREHKIQVNTISPSDTSTEAYKKFFPEEDLENSCVNPNEIAKTALFFASSESDNITGQCIVVRNKNA